MKHSIIILLACLIASFAFGQPSKSAQKQQPSSHSIVTLAQKLTEDLQTEKEKAEAFYHWIADHIEYDYKALQKNKYAHLQSAKTVFARKKAVCYGYSQLFNSLCEVVGIEAVTVVGYTKNPEHELGDTYYMAEHAWNAVQLDGEWHVLDMTFGSGYLGPKKQAFRRWLFKSFGIPFVVKQKFYQQLEPFFFLPKPDTLIYSHLAVNPTWQLLKCPLPISEFESLDFRARTYQYLWNKEAAEKENCLAFEKNAALYSQMEHASKRLNDGKNGLQFNGNNHRIARDGYFAYANELMKQEVSFNPNNLEKNLQQLEARLDYYKQATAQAVQFRRDMTVMQRDYLKKVAVRHQLIVRNNAPMFAKNNSIKQNNPRTVKKLESGIGKLNKTIEKIQEAAAKMGGTDISKVRRRRNTDLPRITQNDSLIQQNEQEVIRLQQQVDSITKLIAGSTDRIQANLDSIQQLYRHNTAAVRLNTHANINTHLVLNEDLPVISSIIANIQKRLKIHQSLVRENALIENREITQFNKERYKLQATIVALLRKNCSLVAVNKSCSATDRGEDERYHQLISKLVAAHAETAIQHNEKIDRLASRMSFLKQERALAKQQAKVLKHEMNYENLRMKQAAKYIEAKFTTLLNRNTSIMQVCQVRQNELQTSIKTFYKKAKEVNPDFGNKM